MMKSLLSVTSFGVAFCLACSLHARAETAADNTKAAAEKATGAAKKPADAAKAKAAEAKKPPPPTKPAEKKSRELSAADQALLAHAQKESAKLSDAQTRKLLDLVNTGDGKALQDIPGIGEVKSKSITKARPFKSVADLIMVEGIGEVTFDEIVKWTKDGMHPAAPADKAAAKHAPKPAPAKPTTAPDPAPAKPAAKPGSIRKPA